MGVFTYENEQSSSVAPARFYKALATDGDSLIPKAVEPIHSIEIVEGNGGPGSIKKLTYSEGGETKHVLHKVEVIDEANYGYKYSIVGGPGLPDTAEKISFETKLVEGPNGGSIGKVTVTYFTKTDAPPSEEERLSGKAKDDALFKAVEAYLLAHPEYN